MNKLFTLASGNVIRVTEEQFKQLSDEMKNQMPIIAHADGMLEKLENKIKEKLLSKDIYFESDDDGYLICKMNTYDDGVREFYLDFLNVSEKEIKVMSKGISLLDAEDECIISPSDLLNNFSYDEIAHIIAIIAEREQDVAVYDTWVKRLLY